MREINSLFPNIYNLEYFPIQVLLKIFVPVDDGGLLNLARNSSRFESIAQIVLNGRYTTKYFLLNESDYKMQSFQNSFQFFGSESKAIEAISDVTGREDNWIVSLLNRANNHEKLKLDLGRINESTNEFLLCQHVNSNITHLTLRIGRGYTEKNCTFEIS